MNPRTNGKGWLGGSPATQLGQSVLSPRKESCLGRWCGGRRTPTDPLPVGGGQPPQAVPYRPAPPPSSLFPRPTLLKDRGALPLTPVLPASPARAPRRHAAHLLWVPTLRLPRDRQRGGVPPPPWVVEKAFTPHPEFVFLSKAAQIRPQLTYHFVTPPLTICPV